MESRLFDFTCILVVMCGFVMFDEYRIVIIVCMHARIYCSYTGKA